VYAFLSPEWVDAVRTIRDDYKARVDAQLQHSGDDIAVNLLVTDVPHGAEDVRAHAALRSTGTDIDLGHLDEAKILVTVDYKTARSAVIDQDIKAIIRGFLLGKIAIRGDLAALLVGPDGKPVDPAAILAAFDVAGYQSLGEIDPTAGEIAARIRAITT
jgi:hypothetical protein